MIARDKFIKETKFTATSCTGFYPVIRKKTVRCRDFYCQSDSNLCKGSTIKVSVKNSEMKPFRTS